MELEATNGDDLPKMKVARPTATANVALTTQLTGKLDAMLQAKYGAIFRDEDRSAIVEDFRRFIERHKPATLLAERASAISVGFDGVLPVLASHNYLNFFPAYRSLKWRLWMAMNAAPLSPEQIARREQQRDEWRKFIRTIPITETHIIRTHGHAIFQLERLFENPWHGWFHEPLSDEELARMERERKHWNLSNSINAHSNFDTIVMRVKADSVLNDPKFGSGSPPLDAEVLANGKSDLFRFHKRFTDETAFLGPVRDLVFDEAPKLDRRILDFNKPYVDLPKSVPLGLDAVQKWANAGKVGLLAYESARHGLFMLRGAKLGVLPVSSWHEADRLTH